MDKNKEALGALERLWMKECTDGDIVTRRIRDDYAIIKSALTAPVPSSEHFDDQAVDFAAKAMKEKLAKKRAEGRGGWQYPDQCTPEFLSKLLREHIDKGDPVDVLNLAMMLFVRGDRISPAAPAPVDAEVQRVIEYWKEHRQVSLADVDILIRAATKPAVPREVVTVDDDVSAAYMVAALRDYKIQQGVFGDTAAQVILRYLKANGLRIVRGGE